VTLSTRIAVALVAGAALGVVARLPSVPWLREGILLAEPVGIIFIRLMNMIVVPLVVSTLFAGIASLGDVRRLGRIGGRTLVWFAATTAAAAVLGTTVAIVSGVGLGAPAGTLAPAPETTLSREAAPGTEAAQPTFAQALIDLVPQNPVAAASQGDLLPLIVAVCLFAAAAAVIGAERRRIVVAFFEGVRDLSMVVIDWVMRLAPLAVLVLVAVTVARSGLAVLGRLVEFMVVVIVVLAAHVAIVLLPALRIGARLGVRAFWTAAADALLLAGATASSTGALPVSLAAAERLHVPRDVAGFVLPTGTTVNKNGAAAYKAVTAVFIARLSGMALGPAQWLTIAAASTAAAFAGAGVPGSSLVTTMIVLNALGPGVQAAAGIALVAGVDRPLDMGRTLVNTAGNLVGAAVVGRMESPRASAHPVA